MLYFTGLLNSDTCQTCYCKPYFITKSINLWVIYSRNYSLAKSMVYSSNCKQNQIPIYSCFKWKEIIENWKICACYLLNLGYNINFISIGDIRLFCSSTQLFKDIMHYYPFISSLTTPSICIVNNNYNICLTSSNIKQLNSDLLIGFLNDPILIFLKLNLKFLSLIEIASIKLWKLGLKVKFGNTNFEKVINSKRISGYYTMIVFLMY
ncbi:Precorrin-2 C(20)-methyltransferase [Candidatus Hodgkinia cicadicola]|uniref:Precorrin-2 C(20)-methyltransferase n=1 Tax=Candidatus Hodgkinia cicadicola TaxID=573658 RepID=A0ABX4MGD7_9HYPH|nr:Precorrin-2 C(20)-methyltransferase [Candidatus Hodgkinia cicadicola]